MTDYAKRCTGRDRVGRRAPRRRRHPDRRGGLRNPALYAEAHLPGAIGFDWKQDLQDQVKRDFPRPRGLREADGKPRASPTDHTVLLLTGDRKQLGSPPTPTGTYFPLLRPRQGQADQRTSRESGSPRIARPAPTRPLASRRRRSRRRARRRLHPRENAMRFLSALDFGDQAGRRCAARRSTPAS